MKTMIIVILSIFLLIAVTFAFKGYTPIRIFDRAGEGTIMGGKIWRDTITASTGNGFNIDISTAGFTNIGSVNVMALRNSATAVDIPNVALKSVTTTALTVNITQGNGSLVSVLGFSVLQGASMQFVPDNSVVLYVIVIGK